MRCPGGSITALRALAAASSRARSLRTFRSCSRATRFLNAQATRMLGLNVPQTLLATVDEVID